jgi:hypothetical protein
MSIRDLLQAWISVVSDHFTLLHANHNSQPAKDAWKPAAGDYFIQLTVQHEGSRQRPVPGVYAYAFLCQNGGGGNPSVDLLKLADMPRYNLAKCQALAQEVLRQIEGKDGPVRDMVLAVKEKHRARLEAEQSNKSPQGTTP